MFPILIFFFSFSFSCNYIFAEFQEIGGVDRGDRAIKEQCLELGCKDRANSTPNQQSKHRKVREGFGRSQGRKPGHTSKTEKVGRCLTRERVV